MKKTRTTRKPFKNNPKIVTGTIYPAGALIAQVSSFCLSSVDVFKDERDLAKNGTAKKSRDAMVMFDCNKCQGGIGLTMFRKLEDGTAVSCGCQEDAAYKGRYDRQLETIHRQQRRVIFSDAYFSSRRLAADKHKLDKVLVDWIVRAEWKRLSDTNSAILESIYVAAQSSAEAAIRIYKRTRAEVMAICKIVSDRLSKDVAARESAISRLTPEQTATLQKHDEYIYFSLLDIERTLNARVEAGGKATFKQTEYKTTKNGGGHFYTVIKALDYIPDALGLAVYGKGFTLAKKAGKRTAMFRSIHATKIKKTAAQGKEVNSYSDDKATYERYEISPVALAHSVILLHSAQ